MGSRTSFGLPLLGKELIEQSARRRTYVLRTIYALLFFGFALFIFWGQVYSHVETPFELLGQGRELFMILMMLQVMGVLLFTPALTCGSISSEKERNTIGLLFLTRLGPTSILLEKYLGRLLIMGTYLLISLPMFGFCYTLGGVEQRQVWFGFYGLLITVCQISALGLLCSTYFRTTVSAFIATYLWGILLFFGPVFLFESLPHETANTFGEIVWAPVDHFVLFLGHIGAFAWNGLLHHLGLEQAQRVVWAPNWVHQNNSKMEAAFAFFTLPMILNSTQGMPAAVPNWQILAYGLPSIFSTMVFLMMSRVFLVTRAFMTPTRYLLRMFKSLDSMFNAANNNRVTKGIVLIKPGSSLPGYEPITWRETTKTALGSFRYLIRIFFAIEVPVLVIGLSAIQISGSYYSYNRHPAMVFVNLICWIIALLLTIVRAASCVSGERTHETLDVLLTTPISSRQFVSQKFKGVLRLMMVVGVPLATGMVLQAWYSTFNSYNSYDADRSTLFYVVSSFLSVVIYLPLFAWISMFFGMWMKTSTRAIFAALAFAVAWIVIPFVVVIMMIEAFDLYRNDSLELLLIASPATVPFATEIGEVDDIFENNVWFGVTVNFLVYGILLFAVRHFCMMYAARLLGRSEDDWT